MRRHAVVMLAALGMVAAGCLGQPEEEPAGEPGAAIRNADAKDVTLVVTANAVAGGKNAASAAWMENWVIPNFVAAQKAKGVNATVTFEGNGGADEQYKTKIALDLKTGGGADIVNLDGIWVGEFADAGYIKQLTDVAGPAVDEWDGWRQIPEAVQGLGEFDGKRYAVPNGTDGRVLYFNKKLFAQAGLPADWQPTSWDEVITAAQQLKGIPGITPIQLNGGTAMGEATTMQGVLPALVGTGAEVYADGKWQGDTPNVTKVLELYERIYGAGLGDPLLQQEAKGRDKSFQLFAENKIGILLEGDYLWRGVLEPTVGVAKMADRDTAVGWAKIPAFSPGGGIRGQDFVSMSGGGVRVINPNTEYPAQAWELLQFMNSAAALKAELAGQARVTQREDVNAEILAGDPLLSFIAKEVLPITAYRPGLAAYPQVSAALQQATADVIAGKSVPVAAAAYREAVARAVGEDKVATG
ncbi:MAG TPA: extracellular solute-binding protein [Pseudonocardiaceae bacterium]